MPPYLSMPYFHLSKLPITTKICLTGFSLATLAGIIFVGLVYFLKILEEPKEASRNMLEEEIGTLEATRRHFAPQETQRKVMEKLEAPPKEVEKAVRDQKEGQKRKAYDIVHPHSFLMPVVYFILCHLMEMTAVRRGVKIGLYSGGFVGMMLTIFAPITILSMPWLTIPTFIGLYVMLIAFAVMTVVPTAVMWFSKAK